MNLDKLIIEKIDPNLNQLEKARFIYLELAKIVNFDTTFNNSGVTGYYDLLKAKVSIYNIDTTQVNCRMWSQLYSQLLYKVDIPNRIVNNHHQHVLFEIDGKAYAADATVGTGYSSDLSKIKNHELTDGFRPWSLGFNSDKPFLRSSFNQYDEWNKELDKIDEKVRTDLIDVKKLQSIKKSFNLLRDDKMNSKTGIDFSEIEQKLDVMFSAVGKMNDGFYESKDFIRSLEFDLFTMDELDYIKGAELKRVNNKQRVDIIECIYINSDNPKYYLLGQNNSVKKVNANDVKELEKAGFAISNKKKNIPGVNIKNIFSFDKNNKFKMANFKERIKNLKNIKYKFSDDDLTQFVETSSLEYNDKIVFGR